MSSDMDLAGEVCASHAGVKREWREKMLAAGIPAISVALGWVGILPCLAEGNSFQPVERGGTEMVIVPVKHGDTFTPEHKSPEDVLRFGPIADLVAFDLDHPMRWYQRTGAATWLGCIRPQIFDPDPVHVWRCPLNWLRNGGVGLVPLTRVDREARDILLSVGKIVAEDAYHAAQLKRIVERPFPIPPILIPDTRRAA
jgi:hypothetical protein